MLLLSKLILPASCLESLNRATWLSHSAAAGLMRFRQRIRRRAGCLSKEGKRSSVAAACKPAQSRRR